MKNRLSYLSIIIILLSSEFPTVYAQCTPPMSEYCAEADNMILCSLDELNGYVCTNLSTIPSPCSPICSQGGVGNNTSWWAFINNGGNVSITLNVGTCTSGEGLEFGIWGNCSCNQEIVCRSNPCTTPGSSNTVNVSLLTCKTYFLWVDGCNGDVCDFTLNTTGGDPPVAPPLGKINNQANMIIEPVCPGACYYFFVDQPPSACFFIYEWTWEGTVVQHGEKGLELDLPNTEGDFTICVKPKVIIPYSGMICSEGVPVCATVKIRETPDRIGLPRTLCWEQCRGSGYKWYSKNIFTSGTYTQSFSFADCCSYDSIVDFTVLEAPLIENVYYVSCDSLPYKDFLGRKYPFCLDQQKLILPKVTNPFKCDSTISLTTINSEFATAWNTQCIGGMIELLPNVHILNPCNIGEIYHYQYRWFRKSAPNDILGQNEKLLVQSVSDDYCIQVTVETEFQSEIAICTKTFCESFNEGNLAPECSFSLYGNKLFCFDPVGVYQIDSFYSQKVNFFNWSVDGGQIISNPDSSAVLVNWLLNSQDTGKICLSYNTDCGISCQKCKTIVYETKIAGEDFEHRGLSAYLDAKPHPNGMWRLISGPHQVRIEDPSFARTKITAFNYGYYCFEWSVVTPNCTLRDTLCVNLHYFKKASPEYPELLFFDRSTSVATDDDRTEIVFTPNLIDSYGESYVAVSSKERDVMKYHWFDIFGRIKSQANQSIESGVQKVQILSPINPGMYLLLIELNGVKTIRKVCVME